MAGSLESRRLVILSVKSNVFIGLTGTQHRYRLHTTKLRPMQSFTHLIPPLLQHVRTTIRRTRSFIHCTPPISAMKMLMFCDYAKICESIENLMISFIGRRERGVEPDDRWASEIRRTYLTPTSPAPPNRQLQLLSTLWRQQSANSPVRQSVRIQKNLQHSKQYDEREYETGVTKTFKIFCIWYKNTKSLHSIPKPLIRQAACFGNDQL
ncbi:unnamed protein product [Nesidiocoris tenuis]|uniref:Uncharacterized protein n=1 Tax=Nesidiocoris tenuis TaxID=355587 RepID=A0A6H5GFY6_9HEMI|nr:unnamed protein product [Nesidiocoris tenuis]